MTNSSVPTLVALILAFLPLCTLVAARRYRADRPSVAPLIGLCGVLGLWVGVSTWASITDFYDWPEFLVWYPGLWLPVVPISIAVSFYLLSPALRRSLERTLNGTPRHWHVLFQGLRIVSLGAIYKAYLGTFPIYFAVFSGGLDLLYALSAFPMAWWVRQGKVSRKGLIVWNVVGFLVLGLTAPLLLQLGLPGSMQLLFDAPLSDVILAFPMALAPTFTGPMFMTMNALWIKHLLFDEKSMGPRNP